MFATLFPPESSLTDRLAHIGYMPPAEAGNAIRKLVENIEQLSQLLRDVDGIRELLVALQQANCGELSNQMMLSLLSNQQWLHSTFSNSDQLIQLLRIYKKYSLRVELHQKTYHVFTCEKGFFSRIVPNQEVASQLTRETSCSIWLDTYNRYTPAAAGRDPDDEWANGPKN